MHTDADPVGLAPQAIRVSMKAGSPWATCGRAEPGLWMREMLQIKTAAAHEPL